MENIQNQLGLSDESYGKLKLFSRILIAYNDFKQAHEIASLLVEGDFYENYPEENRQLVIALNMAAIVAYSRPFLDSRGELAHSRLPGKVLRILSVKEREVHETVLVDRNTAMAHSDADANLAIPIVMELENGKIIIPKNASAHEKILLPEAMELLCGMSYKLQEFCFELRQNMEAEMMDILPLAEFE